MIYALVCGIVFLFSTILMGILFPVLNQIFYSTTGKQPGKSVSKIYVINTFGSIAGALAAGFILIPSIGIKWSIIILAVINMVIGIFFILKSKQKSAINIGVSVVGFFVLLLISL